MKYVTKTNNKTALLALVAVFAMIAAGAAVVMASPETEAATAQSGALVDADGQTVVTASEDKEFYYVNGADKTLTIGALEGTAKLFIFFDSAAAASDIQVNFAAAATADAKLEVYIALTAKDATSGKVTYNDADVLKFAGAAAAKSVEISATAAKITFVGDALPAVETAYIFTGVANTYDAVMNGQTVTLTETANVFTVPAGATFSGIVNNGQANTLVYTAAVQGTAGTVTYNAAGPVITGTLTAGSVAVTAGKATYTDLAVATSAFVAGIASVMPDGDKDPAIYATIPAAIDAEVATPIVIGSYSLFTNTTVGQSFTVAPGCHFIIPAKYTLTVQHANAVTALTVTVSATASMDVFGKVVGKSGTAGDPAVTYWPVFADVAGTVNLYQAGSVTGIVDQATLVVKDCVETEPETKIGGTIDQNLSCVNAKLIEDITIAKGYSLTISGVLDTQGNSITVNGTLVVESGAYVIDTVTDSGAINITIGKDGDKEGVIKNSGTIGKNFGVIYTVAGKTVTLKGIEGITVAYSSTGPVISGTTAAIAGSFSKFSGTEQDSTLYEPYIAVNGATIKDTTISTNTDLETGASVSSVTGDLIIAGTAGAQAAIPEGKLLVKAGASVTVSGKYNGTLNIVAGEEQASDKYATSGATISGNKPFGGFSVESVKDKVTTEEATYYNYRAYFNGILAGDAGTTVTFTAAKMIIVDEALVVPNTITLTGAFLAVTGLVTSGTDIAPAMLYGAYYKITGTAATWFAEDAVEALEDIALYDSQTVTLYGMDEGVKESYVVDLPEDLTIEKDQKVISAGFPILSIPEGVSLTVDEGATVEADILAAIDGMVVVIKGGNCEPAPGLYDVTYGNEIYTVYCGFQTALDNAEPGDVIEFSGARTFALGNNLESLSVPAGVKLSITGALDITRSLTVAATGAVEVTGTLTIGKVGEGAVKGVKLQVAGEADFTAGKTIVNGKDAANKAVVTVTGVIEYTDAAFDTTNNVTVSGFIFVDGSKYITTLENAVESGKAINVTGTVTDTSSFALKANMTIDDGATAQFGTVDIKGYTITATGALTATIAGVTGTDDAVSLAVTGFKGTVQNTATSSVYSMKVNSFTAGSVTVATGTASMGGNFAATGNTLTVANGATLALDTANNYSIETPTQVYNGTIDVQKGQLTLDAEKLAINGAVMVAEGAELVIDSAATIAGAVDVLGTLTIDADVLLTGSIIIDDSEDSTAMAETSGALVMGTSAIGGSGVIDGKLILVSTLLTDGYIKAFPGAVIDPATLELANKSTVAYVNGAVYCTVYATADDVLLDGVINDNITVPGYNMAGVNDITKWKDQDGDNLVALGSVIGDPEKAFFSGIEQTATVKVSVATGMSIYVDGVKYASGTDIPNMAMGAHTVSVTVNPGYKYADGTTATITFDGKVLSGLLVFNITADMANKTVVLSAIGDIVVDQPEPTPQEKEDNTVIMVLLAVLVVMVVILAIVTVLRMMRS